MVTTGPRVILIANDVVPGMAMPVAAPGLRVFGLAHGLAVNNVDVTTVTVQGPVDGQWNGSVPPPSQPGTEVIAAADLNQYLESRAPAVAIITNSNQVNHLRPIPGIRYVLDFFAPKMLERAYEYDSSEYPMEELAALRVRKLRAIELAESFIVNGHKKVPYFLAWILQTDRDVRQVRMPVVEMCVPGYFPEERPEGPLRFALAGYLQSWSKPGEFLDILIERLRPEAVVLDAVLPVHWGQRQPGELSEPLQATLGDHPAVTMHGAMTFGDFRTVLGSADVAIDLFDHSLERELAMVTRTVVALASGVPVIHPPFTEVSPMIEQYDAGWLIEPDRPNALADVLDQIIDDPGLVTRKRDNTRRLWEERLDPRVATRPLIRLIRTRL